METDRRPPGSGTHRLAASEPAGRELVLGASWISNFSSVNDRPVCRRSPSTPKTGPDSARKPQVLPRLRIRHLRGRPQGVPLSAGTAPGSDGEYYLVKTDILAGTMSFSSSKDTMTNVVTLPVARVKEIIALNRAGKKGDQSCRRSNHNRGEVRRTDLSPEEDSITRFDGNGSKRKCATDAAATGQRNARTGTTVPQRKRRRSGLGFGIPQGRKQEPAANRSERREKRDRRERNNRNCGQGESRPNQRGERNNGQGEPRNHATANRNGSRNGQSTQKNEQRPNAGTPPANRTVNAATVRALAANSAGNVVRRFSFRKPSGQNGSETDPTPTHSQSPGEEVMNGARRRPRGRGGRNRREGNRSKVETER